MADPSFHTMLVHIESNLPSLWRFVTGGTYLAGVFFAVRAILQFKEYGEAQMSKGQTRDLRKPLVGLLIATVLLYWPDIYRTLMVTVFNADTPSPFRYKQTSNYNDLIKVCGHLIQFIGFIAFIRGWMLLSRIYQQGAQQGAFAKAITHVIGGLLAINVFGTWAIIEATLGIG